jgi:hypothetical protein
MPLVHVKRICMFLYFQMRTVDRSAMPEWYLEHHISQPQPIYGNSVSGCVQKHIWALLGHRTAVHWTHMKVYKHADPLYMHKGHNIWYLEIFYLHWNLCNFGCSLDHPQNQSLHPQSE